MRAPASLADLGAWSGVGWQAPLCGLVGRRDLQTLTEGAEAEGCG